MEPRIFWVRRVGQGLVEETALNLMGDWCSGSFHRHKIAEIVGAGKNGQADQAVDATGNSDEEKPRFSAMDESIP